MSDSKNEKTFEDRRPILLDGEHTDTQPARDADTGEPDSGLTTSDIAHASERRTSAADTSTRRDDAASVGKPEAVSGKPGTNGGEESAPLFSADEARELRSRWDAIQVGFVDEPRRAVEQADGLVASTVKRLAEMFADERSKLEQQWSRGDQVSTEDLRIALRRYRSFFGRLLSV